MSSRNKYTGFAIAIAWPQTYCKQPGSWYDPFVGWLGINKNNYYKAGHAALVLIDSENKSCHYFDFGRYHAPFQHGRVRSSETDHDLEMKSIPVISPNGKRIENFEEIISELQNNPACHGEGELYASYSRINFVSAQKKAKQMQIESPIPYGPFKYKGSNCSRFVNTAILAGNPGLKQVAKLKYFVPLTPTPLNNVNALDHKMILAQFTDLKAFSPVKKPDKGFLKTTLQSPERDPNIPANAQWLGGEGAGSWFNFEFQNKLLKVTRYSPSGVVECTGLYKNLNGHKVSPTNNYKLTYPANCKVVSLLNEGAKVKFERAVI